jgi:hypothetical protein
MVLFGHVALRPSMAAALLRHVLTQSGGWRDLWVILVFRRVRTRLAMVEARAIGYREFEVTSKATGTSVAEVEEIVGRWLHQAPIAIVKRHAFSGVDAFFALLRERGARTACFLTIGPRIS